MFWMIRRKGGGWTALFPPGGAEDLVGLPGRLRAVLEKPDFGDKVVARLFPQAFRDDPEAEAEYQGLLREDLLRRKIEGVEAFARTMDHRRERKVLFGVRLIEVALTDEELTLWLGFLHDMRLLIGTRLDITDEGWQEDVPAGPEGEEYRLLHRLAYMEEAILEALREAERLERLG
jgi:hypothetical protein